MNCKMIIIKLINDMALQVCSSYSLHSKGEIVNIFYCYNIISIKMEII